MTYQQKVKFIANRIHSEMPMRADNPHAFRQGMEVYYLSANDNVVKATILASGGETLYLKNDWCYVWGATPVDNIPETVRF